MSQHVHVRLSQGLVVTMEGELLEEYHCQCGATWTTGFEVVDTEPER